MNYAQLLSLAEDVGLHGRGAFHPTAEDGVPPLSDGRTVKTLVLLGAVGGSLWPAFSRSPEYHDGREHPLDRWSARVISHLARTLGCEAVFPFGGPPHYPFQRWAQLAEPLTPSPLGLLIHPDYGLWHAYRGALLFPEELELPARRAVSSPCESCIERPCLAACPVAAFKGGTYDVAACASHLSRGPEICAEVACLARAACPVGQSHRYPAAQAHFHISAFLRSHSGTDLIRGDKL